MKEKLSELPFWFINLISIIACGISIFSVATTLILFILNKITLKSSIIFIIIMLIIIITILITRVRKYRIIASNRMEKTSINFHIFLHETRDVFFETLNSHKQNTLTTSELTRTCKNSLSNILDNLCEIMSSYTGREISACIKLITYNEDDEIINSDNATLVTFCRSRKSNTNRDNYTSHTKIFLKDNTDFLEIISNDNNKDYFYQGNLDKYAKQLTKVNQEYKNTNSDWKSYYKSTIVVPIRIKSEKLYDHTQEDSYHIIGFVCVDSLKTDAFTAKQERYNVDIVKSFADIIYVLLGQYRHYLKKISLNENQK